MYMHWILRRYLEKLIHRYKFQNCIFFQTMISQMKKGQPCFIFNQICFWSGFKFKVFSEYLIKIIKYFKYSKEVKNVKFI